MKKGAWMPYLKTTKSRLAPTLKATEVLLLLFEFCSEAKLLENKLSELESFLLAKMIEVSH